MIGATGWIRIDGDGDARYSSPLDYARELVDATGGDAGRLMDRLADYDEAVSVQAASVLRQTGVDLNAASVRDAIERSAPHVRQAFVAYLRTSPLAPPSPSP